MLRPSLKSFPRVFGTAQNNCPRRGTTDDSDLFLLIDKLTGYCAPVAYDPTTF